MKTQNALKTVLFGLITTIGFGCSPSFHSGTNQGTIETESMSEESLLSTTSTGQEVLKEMKLFSIKGYSLKVRRVSTATLKGMNAELSTYRIENRSITIYIDNGLSVKDRAHAISHEVSRIKDEFDIEDYLRNHPQVSKDVKEFWDLYDEKGMSGFDWKVVRFAVGVTACKEVRAFIRNKNLSDEGISTEKYKKGDSLSSYLEEVAFPRLELALKRWVATEMIDWCSKYSSMEDIQEDLAW